MKCGPSGPVFVTKKNKKIQNKYGPSLKYVIYHISLRKRDVGGGGRRVFWNVFRIDFDENVCFLKVVQPSAMNIQVSKKIFDWILMKTPVIDGFPTESWFFGWFLNAFC